MLSNLLSNAIKFSDEESRIEVDISFGTKIPNQVTFLVKDNGVGMSVSDQKTLFQPFTQIRAGELQKGRGSGLGLTICKTITTLHGGTMGFHSTERVCKDSLSGGTSLFFSVPFDLPQEEEIVKKLDIKISVRSVDDAVALTTAKPIGVTLCCDGFTLYCMCIGEL